MIHTRKEWRMYSEFTRRLGGVGHEIYNEIVDVVVSHAE
jgi:hypothetical protein